jgi:hypothetical protein
MDIKEALVLADDLTPEPLHEKLLVRLRDRGGPGSLVDRVIAEKEFSHNKPPAPKAGEPLLLSPQVASTLRISPERAPHLHFPPTMRHEGANYAGLFKMCVGITGMVDDVTTIRSTSDATVDEEWKTEVRTWRHRPYLVEGQPRPFCTPVRLTLQFVAPAGK